MAGDVLEDEKNRKSNRRDFVQKLGIAGVAAGVAAAIVPAQLEAADPTTPTDADILNFALNLEFLEAEFYTYATTGVGSGQFGIIFSGNGTQGATTGGSQVTFTDPVVQKVAQELAANEREHVALLQTALASMGGSAAKPAINLGALGIGFGNQTDFLKVARILEDIGVTAYGGAAGLITNKTVLGAAARILATEAEHVGNIRLLLAQKGIASAALDGADVPPPPTGTQFFSTNATAITQTRTPGQVLYLAYGGAANATSGGFFPAGVNGNLVTSSSAAATTDSATFTASPNPISVAPGVTYAMTTLTWNAPSAQYVEVHVGSPNGPLFAYTGSTGTMTTGTWVTDGMVFYLQDVSNGKLRIPQNTLATLIVHFQ